MSPNGKTLAAAYYGGSERNERIILWDLAKRSVSAKLSGPRKEPISVTFSPDSKLVACTEGNEERVFIWNIKTGASVAIINSQKSKPPYQSPLDLAFTPDSKTLVTCNLKAVKLLDVQTKRVKLIFPEPGVDGFYCLALSPDGRTLACAGEYGMIHLWEMATVKKRVVVKGHKGDVTAVAFSPDGRTLATASADLDIKLWDLFAFKEPPTTDAAEMDRLWTALASKDAILAYRAVRNLVASPPQALPFLREHLRPAAAISAELARQIDRWITDLDSEQFAVRQKASRELEHVGVVSEIPLRRALQDRSSLEFRKRVSAILEVIQLQQYALPPEQIQQLRALEVLEHIGTAEARALLQDLAKGVPEARLTQEAKASLARLAKRPLAKP